MIDSIDVGARRASGASGGICWRWLASGHLPCGRAGSAELENGNDKRSPLAHALRRRAGAHGCAAARRTARDHRKLPSSVWKSPLLCSASASRSSSSKPDSGRVRTYVVAGLVANCMKVSPVTRASNLRVGNGESSARGTTVMLLARASKRRAGNGSSQRRRPVQALVRAPMTEHAAGLNSPALKCCKKTDAACYIFCTSRIRLRRRRQRRPRRSRPVEPTGALERGRGHSPPCSASPSSGPP